MGSDPDSDDVVSVDEQSADALLRRLSAAGWAVTHFKGGTTSDSFFEATRALPADPPMGPFPNWDGLADSLCGGIIDLGETSLAIVWRDAGSMRNADPGVFATAVSVLRQVVENVRNERELGRSSARARVYVVGVADLPAEI